MPRPSRGYYLRRNRSGRWEIARAVPGGRVFARSTGTDDRALAEEILAQYRHEQARQDAPERVTVRVIGERYVEWRQQRSRWWRAARSAVRHATEHLGWLPFAEVKGRHATAYAERRAAEGAAVGTVRQELRTAHAMLVWWAERHELTAPRWRLPDAPPPRKRFLSEAEAERLLEHTRAPHVRLFVLLALGTGARKGAILELTWERVDLDRRVIDYGSGSGRKHRAVVPIHAALAEELAAARELRTTRHVIEYGGAPVTQIDRGFNNARQRAGLEDVTIHDMRRTAGSWMLQRGVAIELVAAMLGHRDIRTTRTIYAHLTVEHLREAAEVLGRK